MYLCRSHYLDFLYRKFSLSAVCPATPLLKAVEEDLNSPGADTKNLDTVEQIVEAFNLEVGGCVIWDKIDFYCNANTQFAFAVVRWFKLHGEMKNTSHLLRTPHQISSTKPTLTLPNNSSGAGMITGDLVQLHLPNPEIILPTQTKMISTALLILRKQPLWTIFNVSLMNIIIFKILDAMVDFFIITCLCIVVLILSSH